MTVEMFKLAINPEVSPYETMDSMFIENVMFSNKKLESCDESRKGDADFLQPLAENAQYKKIQGKKRFGYDENGKRITNERVETLLRRCLGVGTIPPKDNHRSVMEQVWVLLMDARNQCHKEAGEPYFRQTVLNIIGYFVEKGLISGTPLDIARCVFSDADVSLAKNVSRGISSNVFPNLADQLLDYYINQLQHGEF